MSERLYIVDAHEDLAWHILTHKRTFSEAENPGDAMITLEGLLRGGVMASIASLFVEHDLDRRRRKEILSEQFALYRDIVSSFNQVREILAHEDLMRLRLDFLNGEKVWGFCLMLEGADLIDSPAELAQLHERNVRVLSLTWNEANQWAGGARTDEGLTEEGVSFLREMHNLGFILDISHLNEKSFWQVMDVWSGPVVATHSNSYSLCPHPRNLKDQQIEALAQRGGVIGLLLYNGFLKPDWKEEDPQVPIKETVRHALHILEIVGDEGLGIGSDFDGGISASDTPAGMNSVSDLSLLADELAREGVKPETIRGIMGENWYRFLVNNL